MESTRFRSVATTVLRAAAALAIAALVAVSGAGGPAASAGNTGAGLQACAPDVEFLGFSDTLDKTSFGGFDVVELSALTYDPQAMVYYAVADRVGPVESHVFTINLPIEANGTLGVASVLDVRVLRDAAGNPFTGLTLDAEGIVLAGPEELIIASEGGSMQGEQPEIRRFSLDGEHLGELPVPDRFLIGTNNLSFESLAIAPSGLRLFTANEAPLADDGRTDDLRSRIRILRYDHGPNGFEPAAEYFYLTEPGRTATDLGVAEMVALSEWDLLVLERGFVAGQGNTIRIFSVSLDGAKDISQEPALASTDSAPLAKTLLVDLVNCPTGGATTPQDQPSPLLDNFEAMALGPVLPSGKQTLLLMSDDNGSAAQVTRVVALAIPAS